jgi:hypothetical protein
MFGRLGVGGVKDQGRVNVAGSGEERSDEESRFVLREDAAFF